MPNTVNLGMPVYHMCLSILHIGVTELAKFYVWGHLQTMWTVFWGFLTPPPPLWTNMDILGTPLPVHVDFSMTPPPSALFPKFQSTNLLEL